MYKKAYKRLLKFLGLVIVSVGVFVFSFFLIWLAIPKIVDVHEIRKNPESIKGNIGVSGKVITQDDNASFFLLFDHDRECKAIPIIHEGKRPESESEIIVYGKFMKVDKTLNGDILWWEYFLETDKIKARKDDLSGNLFYLIRRWVIESKAWLYKNCKKCFIISKLKNSLISTPL